MREYISGRRWFWAATLFACAYPILAALIGAALRLLSVLSWLCRAARGRTHGPDLAELADGRGCATCRQIGHWSKRYSPNPICVSRDPAAAWFPSGIVLAGEPRARGF